MSVTAVPIPPTSKGSLAKFWIGISLLIAAGAGLAYFGTRDVWEKYGAAASYLDDIAVEEGVKAEKSGLVFKKIRGGEGKSPTQDDVVVIELEGKLRDGKVFQEKTRGPMPMDGAIPGFTEALKKMQKGGKYKFWIPPELGYGPSDIPDQQNPGQVIIPGGSVLMFEVTLDDIIPRAEFEKMMKAEQERQQKAGAGAGGPGGGQAMGGGGPQGLSPEQQAQLEAQIRSQMAGQGGAPQ